MDNLDDSVFRMENPNVRVVAQRRTTSMPTHVIYTGEHGSEHLHKAAEQAGLVKGREYFLLRLDVDKSSSEVTIIEDYFDFHSVRGRFNSVMFEFFNIWDQPYGTQGFR